MLTRVLGEFVTAMLIWIVAGWIEEYGRYVHRKQGID